jgi:glutamyl-Q tRNA(Asp) synthetase
VTARLRFAPSPTGRLHLGHAYSALLNDAVARGLGGTWLLRIEDIDPARATPENVAGIEEDLAWLGLDWPKPPRRQSEHMAAYRAAADRLRADGLLYPCFCSRGEIAAAVTSRERTEGRAWPRDPDGAPLYPGTCRHLPAGEVARLLEAGRPHAWRLHMAAALDGLVAPGWTAFDPAGADRLVRAHPARWGDPVIVRKEVPTSYHLAVVVDDAAQGITHVVRGTDLEAATDIHAVLAARLGISLPRYHHHGLLLDAAGLKLAKSRGSESLRALREAGETAASVRRRLGFP